MQTQVQRKGLYSQVSRGKRWSLPGQPRLQATMQFLSLAWRGVPGPEFSGTTGDGELGVFAAGSLADGGLVRCGGSGMRSPRKKPSSSEDSELELEGELEQDSESDPRLQGW